jgi:hypothetical protein
MFFSFGVEGADDGNSGLFFHHTSLNLLLTTGLWFLVYQTICWRFEVGGKKRVLPLSSSRVVLALCSMNLTLFIVFLFKVGAASSREK